MELSGCMPVSATQLCSMRSINSLSNCEKHFRGHVNLTGTPLLTKAFRAARLCTNLCTSLSVDLLLLSMPGTSGSLPLGISLPPAAARLQEHVVQVDPEMGEGRANTSPRT